jgi:hypothetical protein
VHDGRTLTAFPIYLPADEAIGQLPLVLVMVVLTLGGLGLLFGF